MSVPYQEVLEGQRILRPPPSPRHELICSRLHAAMRASVADLTSTRLLETRAEVELSDQTTVAPDLALMTTATGKLWLAAEVVGSTDHRVDTVVKKEIYEAMRLPRLWMVDPRYDNVEVYHATAHGLSLREILALRDVLTEKTLPEFQLIITDLFAAGT